jgi:hypothetical protein
MALRKIHLHTKSGSEHIIRLKTDKCFEEFQEKITKKQDFEIRCENVKVEIKTSELERFEVEVLPEAKKSCLNRIEEILEAVTRIDYRNSRNS